MYRLQQEWSIGGTPREWNTLGPSSGYRTLRAAFRAMEESENDPGGYGRAHRVLDAAGNDVTGQAYAAAGRDYDATCDF